MAACIVCAGPAVVYCLNGAAYLCQECDCNIHSGVVAVRHQRVPVCELCKARKATAYCRTTTAFLCEACDDEIHLHGPFSHDVEKIDVMGCGDGCAAHTPASQASHPAAQKSLGHLSTSMGPAGVPDGPSAAEVARDVKPSGWALDFTIDEAENPWDPGLDISDLVSDPADGEGGKVPTTRPSSPSRGDGMVPSMSANQCSLDASSVPAVTSAVSDVSEVSDPCWALPQAVVPACTADSAMSQVSASFAPTFTGGAAPGAMDLAASHPGVLSYCQLPFCATWRHQEDQPQLQLQQEQQQLQQQQQSPMAASPLPDQPAASGAPLLPMVLHAAGCPVAAPSSSDMAEEPPALTRADRVARYREKRKRLNFHKTIRYASRKAYAEVRPRVRGRFVRSEDLTAWSVASAGAEDAAAPAE